MNPIFVSEPELARVRKRLAGGDPELKAEAEALDARAQALLNAGPWSVTQIEELAPSGNPHDYHSLAPCAWPNPEDPTGPWIECPDQLNPDLPNLKRQALASLAEAVGNLAASFSFLGHAEHGRRAAILLRRWFLDQGTAMIPHLDYGHGIPGVCAGRSHGIIDTACLLGVVQAVGYLENSTYWTPHNHAMLQDWFRRYNSWLLNSPLGKEETAASDYHSTFCAAQIGAYAVFCHNASFLERIYTHYRQYLVPTQMAEDGSFHIEVQRPASWLCALANLDGYALICELAYQQGVDLYNWRTPDGRGFPSAVAWLAPYVLRSATWPWPYPQEPPYEPGWSLGLHFAALRLRCDDWRQSLQALPAGNDSLIGALRLLHPLTTK